jgi:pimeloyl-ACP methyl ester carboxylesterase
MTAGGYDEAVFPAGVRSRMVESVTGLNMHVLEAGFEVGDRPCVLLLHGFPELAYSWRKVMPMLAAAGFHVLAPDQRGYGCTSGSDDRYDGDLASFHILNLVNDIRGLVAALGIVRVTAVVGHDFGSPVAAWCALLHPEVFRSVVLLSAPFSGAPRPQAPDTQSPMTALSASLAALSTPRKHYQSYYSTREANADMHGCAQGVHAFLRAYYHCKSADWKQNTPFPLTSWAAAELAKMPKYYIMDLDQGMADTVAEMAPLAAQCRTSDLQRRIRAQVIPGRAAVVPQHARSACCRAAADIFGPPHRCAVLLHRREERLGHLSKSRRTPGNEHIRLQPVSRHPPH